MLRTLDQAEIEAMAEGRKGAGMRKVRFTKSQVIHIFLETARDPIGIA
jgi:hypothetical protein